MKSAGIYWIAMLVSSMRKRPNRSSYNHLTIAILEVQGGCGRSPTVMAELLVIVPSALRRSTRAPNAAAGWRIAYSVMHAAKRLETATPSHHPRAHFLHSTGGKKRRRVRGETASLR